MKFKWMKAAQKKISSHIRGVNKAIYNDPLWKARFYIKQEGYTRLETFDDGSGGYLIVRVTFYDKQTGKTVQKYYNNYDYYHMGRDMNNFIIGVAKVWDENPKPTRETSIDYRNC